MHPKTLRLYGLALFGAALFACSSDGTDNNNPGTIALTLDQTSGTVQQGNQTTVNATLTRGGGFTGTVTLTVTGAPTGVTGTLSNVTNTSATITIVVGAATVPGTYPIVLHGTASGVTEATATYSLTVTAATPSISLALTSATLTIVQGASTPTTTVNITRVNFTGDVTLSVNGLPTGVTAAFVPNPANGNSSELTLTVAPTAPVGTFTTLSVQGTGTGITTVLTPLSLTIVAPTPSISLALTNATLTIAQGASTPTTTVNITRVAFAGDVTLSVNNLPTGVTAAFVPNPANGTSAVLTLTVAAGAPTGTFTTLSVQGSGTGITTVTTPLSLTISAGVPAGDFTLSTTPPTSVSVTQGANANVTVNINRTGGNTSDIALTTTGTLPTGMTLALLPTSTTTNSSVLTITTTGATPVGATPIVIHGNTTGLAEQTVNLTINVTAPSGSGNVTVSFAGCDPADKAAWLAFMDGTSGTWTQVTGTADVYNFSITQSKGSLAYVTLPTGESSIFVQNMTQAEFTAGTLTFCSAPGPVGTTVNGTAANLTATFIGNISFGGRSAIAAANGPFQMLNVPAGTFDLIGYMHQLAAVGINDRVFVKRAETPAAGSFPTTVDFAAAGTSSLAVAGSTSLTGLNGGETATHGMTFYTGGSACTPSSLYSGVATAANFVMYGVPSGLEIGGDMHSINVIVSDAGHTSFKFLLENFLDVAARAATPFVLPADLPTPVASDAGGPYKRPQVVVTGIPAEYNVSQSLIFQDLTDVGKSGFISATQGWTGGANVTLTLPNFSGVTGFLNAWAPVTSDNVSWSFSTSGGTLASVCGAGNRFVTASKSGSL